jgi:hypothetical protein
VQAWSGLTGLREIVERLRAALRAFHDEHGRQLLDLPQAPRPDPETPAPVRLIAEFDNLILSHADRTRIISDTARRRLFTRNGIFPGTVLVNGYVSGIWRLTRSGGTAALAIEPFRALTPPDREAIIAEAGRLLAFATPSGLTHTVNFVQG